MTITLPLCESYSFAVNLSISLFARSTSTPIFVLPLTESLLSAATPTPLLIIPKYPESSWRLFPSSTLSRFPNRRLVCSSWMSTGYSPLRGCSIPSSSNSTTDEAILLFKITLPVESPVIFTLYESLTFCWFSMLPLFRPPLILSSSRIVPLLVAESVSVFPFSTYIALSSLTPFDNV